jgi:hypothetical protein
MKQADTKGSFTLSPQRLEKAAEALDQFAFRKNPDGSYLNEEYMRDDARIMARDALSACLGDDMVVVPREPTDEMCVAGFSARVHDDGAHCDTRIELSRVKTAGIYRAMLSAELTERDAG